jgi:hypothetical protein
MYMVRNFEMLVFVFYSRNYASSSEGELMGLAYVLLKGQPMADRQARLWVTDPLGWAHLAESAKPCPACSVR